MAFIRRYSDQWRAQVRRPDGRRITRQFQCRDEAQDWARYISLELAAERAAWDTAKAWITQSQAFTRWYVTAEPIFLKTLAARVLVPRGVV